MSHDPQPNTPASWMHSMMRGDYEEALKSSDRELKARAGKPCWHLPRHVQHIWDGTPLQGRRVLVRCYHGLGDTIQFIRYMPMLRAIAASVTVWAQAPLIPLLETVQGIDHILPLHNGLPEADYDADVEIMELQHVFRTTLSTIPSAVPYLHATPKLLLPAGKEPAVGLVWKAGDWDERRSVPYAALAPLAEVKGIRLFVLQGGAQAAGWQEGFGTYPGDFPLHDYARVISGLDLLISVDSMPAHLAGALGIPVWNLLHTGADWRWMEKRDDSPWYPTMRLFRQERPGEWEPVIRRVADALHQPGTWQRQVLPQQANA